MSRSPERSTVRGVWKIGEEGGRESDLARQWRDDRLEQKSGQEGPLNEQGGELSIYTFMVSRNIEFRDTLDGKSTFHGIGIIS